MCGVASICAVRNLVVLTICFSAFAWLGTFFICHLKVVLTFTHNQFLSKQIKNVKIFRLKMFLFTAINHYSLHRCVIAMTVTLCCFKSPCTTLRLQKAFGGRDGLYSLYIQVRMKTSFIIVYARFMYDMVKMISMLCATGMGKHLKCLDFKVCPC